MEILKFYVPVSPDALMAILRFIPRLQNLRPEEVYIHAPGEMIAEEPLTFRMHGEYHPLVEEFRQELYAYGFVQDYDWTKFHSRALEIYKRPELLSRVTLRTCVKLLTLYVRKDRFVDGLFARMVQEGHMTAILQRMAGLLVDTTKMQARTAARVAT